jgi:hypothetical protein
VAVPVLFPVTTPPAVTVATVASLVVHPPPVVLLSVVVSPRHKDILPVMGSGGASTVNVAVVKQEELS